MCPSIHMLPNTIIDPPTNQSHRALLQATFCSPRLLQTFACLSHVLRVNLLLVVKSTEHQWWTYQFWYSVTNTSWAVLVLGTRRCHQISPHATESDTDPSQMKKVRKNKISVASPFKTILVLEVVSSAPVNLLQGLYGCLKSLKMLGF